MNPGDVPLEFKPNPGSRRPEWLSWSLAALLAGLAVWLGTSGGPAVFGAWALCAYFGLSALVMSLGNWVERNTRLTLREAGLTFRRPFQTVEMAWDEIRRIEVRKGPVGGRIFVTGGTDRFSLRLAHQVEIRGRIRDRYGFAESELIVQTMIEKANLKREPMPFDGGTYYGRD